MKRSISELGQPSSFTAGGAVALTGWNDQNRRCSSLIENEGGLVAPVGAVTGPDSGQGRPISTQRVRRRDLAVGELALGRHLGLVDVADRLDEQALLGLAGDGRRATVAALLQPFERIKPQTALGFGLGAVALEAPLDQDGADLGLEELGRGVIVFTRAGRRRNEPKHERQGQSRTARLGAGTGGFQTP